ncbi:MAG: nicotinate (nicotinamide) nucleotide adenylyltransferase, partial [Thermodesulfovibrionales bacterium]|nr:nicotinate (nicotinamide) nucleotide adenylyltransferase [Thermodesulfovibrionales bacterium]
GNPPLKTNEILDAKERYKLVKKAISNNSRFQASPIEIKKVGRSYTLETVIKITKQYEDKELFLMMGIDAFCDLHLWYKPEKLIELIDFIVIMRHGFVFKQLQQSQYLSEASKSKLEKMQCLKANLMTFKLKSKKNIYLLNNTSLNISSTTIRENIKKGQSIRYLVPDSICTEVYEKYEIILTK